MKFKYEIYDYDVGGNVHDNDSFKTIDEVIDVVADDLMYDFEGDADFDPDVDKLKADLKTFDAKAVVRSLANFNFANGFCKWSCILPGGHRELRVSKA